jgi:tripartite-type tricarboxylate transporter receptor subunit TctC
MVHVPFRGSGDALPALLADHVQVAILALTGALPLLDSKQVKALATGGSQHFSELPGVPTFAEAGYPQLDFKIWYGLMARRGTPQPILDLLSKETLKYLTSDEFRNVTAVRNRWTVTPEGPAEFTEFLKKDREVYGKAIDEAKLPKLD